MNKKLIISFVLSSAFCAPFVHAMNLLPRARQVAAMVMNPSVRSAVTQANRTVATAAARNSARTVSETAQIARQPMTQSLSRSFATQAPKAAQNSQQQSRAGLVAAGIGLAGAIGGGLTYVQADAPQNPFPKDFLTTMNQGTLMKMMLENPDSARQFAELVTEENFKDIDHQVLCYIIIKHSEAAKEFTPYAVENFASLVSTDDGRWFLSGIMNKNPEAGKEFTLHAVKHFASLVSTGNGRWFLREVIKKNQGAVKTFTPYVTKHFGLLVSTEDGIYFLSEIMEKNQETAKAFTPYVIENLVSLVSTYNGRWFLSEIMEKNQEAAKELTPYVIERVGSLVNTDNGRLFLEMIMETNQEAAKALISYVVSNIKTMLDSEYGIELMKSVGGYNAETLKDFAKYAENHCQSLYETSNGIGFLAFMAMKFPDKKPVFAQKLKPKVVSERNSKVGVSIEDMRRDIFDKFISSESVTPTELGLLYDYYNVKERFKNSDLQKVVQDVIETERRYHASHYTFVHGRESKYDLMHMTYRILLEELKDKRISDDFKILYANQAIDPVRHYSKNPARELFMNSNLFDNSHVTERSALSYFVRGYNEGISGNSGLKLASIFSFFGLQELYEKHKASFDEIEAEHKKLYPCQYNGELLVVAVPKDTVDEFVYMREWNVSEIYKKPVKPLLEGRNDDPGLKDNQVEFILGMPAHKLSNRNNGLKIHSIDAVDQKDKEAVEAKMKALIASLMPEFKIAWDKKVAEARARNKPIYDAIKPIENAAVFHRVNNVVTAQEQHPGFICPGHSGSANYAGHGK